MAFRSVLTLLLVAYGTGKRVHNQLDILSTDNESTNGDSHAIYTMKIVSWNVECLNRATPAELSDVLAALDADIILTQEDLMYPDTEGQGLKIPGYAKAAECRRNSLWDTYKEYANGARYMSNAAYYRQSTIDLVSSSAEVIAADSVDPRCAAQMDVKPHGVSISRPIRVESTHLTGGRFSDSKWEERVGLKAAQVQSLMALSPDVVAGDLNSYATAEDAAGAQKSYNIYTEAVAAGKKSQYLAWTTEPIDEFAKEGMTRLPLEVQTSQFGGTVDHAFTGGSRNGLIVSGNSMEVLSSNDWTLSDHNGLVFDVRIADNWLFKD